MVNLYGIPARACPRRPPPANAFRLASVAREMHRARSSAVEHSLHTREVAGSNPAAPIESPFPCGVVRTQSHHLGNLERSSPEEAIGEEIPLLMTE